MPHKGFFSQGLVVLTSPAPSLQNIESVLGGLRSRFVPTTVGSWALGGDSLVMPYGDGDAGSLLVDVVHRPWPDAMGDPQSESELFCAWSMGHFGPFAYPGDLARAAQQAWHWPGASRMPALHDSFIRVRMSYVPGATPDTPVLPPGYSALPELEFATDVVRRLLTLKEAQCYFNPNGERLLDAANVEALVRRPSRGGPLPLELWANVRLFNLGGEPPWCLMDTVGLQQLDMADHEACFARDHYDAGAVHEFLLNMSVYVHEHGPVIRNGDTADGPGNIHWQGFAFESGLSDPPREVLRWFPQDGRARPEGIAPETPRPEP